METEPVSPAPVASLSDSFLSAEEKLQQASQAAATHAFNLAISFGLLPAVILMLVVFLLVRGSLPGLLIAGVIAALGLIIFASLVVNISRERTLQRVYHEQVLPGLLESAAQLDVGEPELPRLAHEYLPLDALLLKYLSSPAEEPQDGSVPAAGPAPATGQDPSAGAPPSSSPQA